MKMDYAWDFQFYMLSKRFIEENDVDLSGFSPPKTDSQMQIFSFLGDFKAFCVKIATEIIDELVLPKYAQKYEMYLKKQQKMNFFDVEELQYEIKEKRILLKICSFKKSSQEKIKSLKHEFKTMKHLSDVLLLMQIKKKNYHYFVPLACKITYKFFFVLAVSLPPLEPSLKSGHESSQVFGPTHEGHYIFDPKIYEDLVLLAKTLNMKPHLYFWSVKSEPLQLALSIFTQVHLADTKIWKDFTAFFEIKSIEDVNSVKEKLKSKDAKEFQIYYLKNTADIFPLCISQNPNDLPDQQNRFRPEFLKKYETPLSSDIFLSPLNTAENDSENTDGYEASKQLQTRALDNFLESVKNLQVLPVSGQDLSKALHGKGVNMRFLGELAKKCRKFVFLEFLKEICEAEMVARVCKEIFGEKMNECLERFWKGKFSVNEESISFSGQESQNNLPEKTKEPLQNFFEESSISEEEEEVSSGKMNETEFADEIRKEFFKGFSEEMVGLMNLVFGKGNSAEEFWEGWLVKRVREKFGYEIERGEVRNAQLLASTVGRRLKVCLKEKENLRMFEMERPFEENDFLGFRQEAESFKLDSLKGIFNQNALFLLETEKRMGNFGGFSGSFGKILEDYIERNEFKKVLKEIENSISKEMGDSIEIIYLMYLKMKVLVKMQEVKEKKRGMKRFFA